MKTAFIAMAAALACSGAAYAQSNVQLTGLADMYAGSVKMAGQDRKGVVGSGGMTTSWRVTGSSFSSPMYCFDLLPAPSSTWIYRLRLSARLKTVR